MLDKLYAAFLSLIGLSFGGYVLLDEIADTVDRSTAGNERSGPRRTGVEEL
ncbi:hypothetical protein [Rhodococcus opacus]|uniref:hypothetical protein n=1 Tax=Rhodococcus opacus TaxID=37919 RepID=UPI0015E8E4A0|nr:hypothetical protein [Rhodococcus opacus]MDJ0418586.1 hypothetical protein [Rhodococcus opacus]